MEVFSRSLLFLSIIHIFLVKMATGNKRVGNLLKVTEATLLLSQPLSELPRLRKVPGLLSSTGLLSIRHQGRCHPVKIQGMGTVKISPEPLHFFNPDS